MVVAPVKRKETPVSNFAPSVFQQRIFDDVEQGTGNVIINAKAGSGKTTTLVEISKRVKNGSVIFVAFSRDIVTTLSKKVGRGVDCKTIHSVGMGCLTKYLGRVKVDEYKYSGLIRDFFSKFFAESTYNMEFSKIQAAQDNLVKLVGFTQTSLIDPANTNAMYDLVDYLGLDLVVGDKAGREIDNLYFSTVAKILKEGEKLAQKFNSIDYIDMIWLPAVWNLTPDSYDWVLTDECQDLHQCQADLLSKLVSEAGKVVLCGDPKQAIFGWAGASCDSFGNLQRKFNAKEYSLPICYRCPESVLRLAQEIVPDIEAAPNAKEGSVSWLKYHQIYSKVKSGDIIISRKTAPLVKLCIELITKRIAARVKGSDIGEGLTALVKEIAGLKGFEYQGFEAHCAEYIRNKAKQWDRKKNKETLLEKLNDKIDSLIACFEAFNAPTVESMCTQIEGLFSDKANGVNLMTVHRAKGQECETVYILDPKSLPLTWKGQRDHEFEQEMNLRYVALTRAMDTLTFVELEEKR